MTTLNIFANFFIDTQERFLRMKDSFDSFRDINAEKWVINVRGHYADQSRKFLKKELNEKLISFKLNSRKGWFHDSRKMLPVIDGDYVLFWLEDHLNQANVKIFDSIVAELKKNRIDYIYYSFWWDGALRERYKNIAINQGTYIDWFDHTIENNHIIQNNVREGVFIIAACAIFKHDLFRKIILKDDPIQKRWPIETPFDFEKRPTDIHWLPLRVALPRQELFASIDDDHVHPGTCLISRGLYPCREQRQTYSTLKNQLFQNKMLNRRPLPIWFKSMKFYQIKLIIKNSLIMCIKKIRKEKAKSSLLQANVYFQGWEYAKLGDYHRNLNYNWSYTPTYIQKVRQVNEFIRSLPRNTKILDLACGEGALVEKYLEEGLDIRGLDLNYESDIVERGDARRTPFRNESFDVVLFLDALEHLAFNDQSVALLEIYRILRSDGYLFLAVPNLAHLNSRIRFLIKGALDRTDIATNHIGERPINEYVSLIQQAGFQILKRQGVTFTLPFIYRKIICRNPKRYRWLHDLFESLAVKLPSLSLLSILVCRKKLR